MVLGVLSQGIGRIPYLQEMLGRRVTFELSPHFASQLAGVVGWGMRSTSQRARVYAATYDLPYIALEDGFLRSWGKGDQSPPLSIVMDSHGIYYDSTRSSMLEVLLNSDKDVLEGLEKRVRIAIRRIVFHHLSKYNDTGLFSPLSLARKRYNRAEAMRRILVVDQTYGDMSVELGGACSETFRDMLAAAKSENNGAQIFVKIHPEVVAGRKEGYLGDVQEDECTVVVCDACDPIGLIETMDQVYVVTSTIGFEALLVGKPVTVFGMPWYAGWGVTDDRQTCSRRMRKRTVDELFAAAYFHYARYLNPVSHKRGTIFDVIEWLVRQREIVDRFPKRFVAVGMRRWKAAHLRPLLSMAQDGVVFVKNAVAAQRLGLRDGDGLIHWGRDTPADLSSLAADHQLPILHLEDGFYRSVGLGSDLIRPHSVVLDEQGLYFDPRGPSDLEILLNTARFSADDLEDAQRVRALICKHRLTKYNTDLIEPPNWPSAGRQVMFVPGQVEDDASIVHGCMGIRTNLGLLQAVREAHPEAFIVYKPHPDVISGNRRGRIEKSELLRHADVVETHSSVVSCIEASDAVHTMTSMSGFEALLRDKPVVVYGRPFYAGWGLTKDKLAFERRTRRLTLDELVAGALLRYPLYWDWELKGFTTCEAILLRLIEERDSLAASGDLAKMKSGLWRRQRRKARALWESLRAVLMAS